MVPIGKVSTRVAMIGKKIRDELDSLTGQRNREKGGEIDSTLMHILGQAGEEASLETGRKRKRRVDLSFVFATNLLTLLGSFSKTAAARPPR